MTERTPPEPNDYGGEALYEGELALLNSDISASILRLSGIYGEHRTRLIKMAQNQLNKSQSNYAAIIKPNSWRTHVTIGFRFY